MKSLRWVVLGFFSTFLFACEQKAPPPPPASPAPRYTNADTLTELYTAKIHLDLYEKDKALESVNRARKRLPYFHIKAPGQSDLLVELTYLSHGTLSRLYIPSVRGKLRYHQTERVLKRLKELEIKPLEYRLVSYKTSIDKKQAEQTIDNALAHLQEENIKDVSSATIHADHELDSFYDMLGIAAYDGFAENRIEFHTMASEVFLKYGFFEIARDALKYARRALSDLRLENKQPKLIEQYSGRLDKIETAIREADPSMIEKIGRTIDGWIGGEKPESEAPAR